MPRRNFLGGFATLRLCASVFQAAAVVVVAASALIPARPEPYRRISLAELRDKIEGGWAGQMIGVSFGAPTEFRFNGKINDGELPWSPERVSNAIHQDDLYVEMTFAEIMDRIGLDATLEQYAEAFRKSGYRLWHANAGARRLLNNGVKAPWSGHPKYNIHANDIDFQIESDFIGLMSPGLPLDANRFCERVGRVMNYGDGLYGGMFISGMYAAAFFESDQRRVVQQGLASLPPQSGYARIIRDVLDWSAQYPDDWKKTWQRIEDKWDKDDPCTDGALRPFNIDARLNGAYVALGLLYGRGDFGRTIEIAARSGQDSDCNPSSAGGVCGVMLGYSRVPDRWKSGIAPLADTKFEFTNYSFRGITESTLDRALKLIHRSGGRVDGNEVLVPHQKTRPPKLEQWDMGVPVERLETPDPAWIWQGAWTEEIGRDRARVVGKSAEGANAEAVLQFTGAAVALVGPYSQAGGKADVLLDGKKSGEINAYILERTTDNDLFHIFGLKQGSHTLRIVTRNDADPRSKGKKLTLNSAVIYRAR